MRHEVQPPAQLGFLLRLALHHLLAEGAQPEHRGIGAVAQAVGCERLGHSAGTDHHVDARSRPGCEPEGPSH